MMTNLLEHRPLKQLHTKSTGNKQLKWNVVLSVRKSHEQMSILFLICMKSFYFAPSNNMLRYVGMHLPNVTLHVNKRTDCKEGWRREGDDGKHPSKSRATRLGKSQLLTSPTKLLKSPVLLLAVQR